MSSMLHKPKKEDSKNESVSTIDIDEIVDYFDDIAGRMGIDLAKANDKITAETLSNRENAIVR